MNYPQIINSNYSVTELDELSALYEAYDRFCSTLMELIAKAKLIPLDEEECKVIFLVAGFIQAIHELDAISDIRELNET